MQTTIGVYTSEMEGKPGHTACFKCPGCKRTHCIPVVSGPAPSGKVWGWNGDTDRTTFTPSIKTWWTDHKGDHVCHSHVIEGYIQFCGDSTHELVNQTVRLPPFTSLFDED